jgi:hypothetical protein
MSGDTTSDDSIARQDVLESAAESSSDRRGVLRGAAAAVGAALGVAGGSGASDLTSMIDTARASSGPEPQGDTFCTYQCIDGTCGCRKYYIDNGFNTCYDYGEWCCTGCTGCEEDCPY